jgi:hypothetical protein
MSFLAVPAAFLALGSLSPALAASERVADMLGLVGLIAKGLTMASDHDQKVNTFITNSTHAVVITNKTSHTWKFGYLRSYASELNDTQSGTFTAQTVSSDLRTWTNLGTLAPDASAVTIPAHYGAIVVKPVFVRTGVMSWEPFFRVCYLEDSKGQRIYLNVTAPATLRESVPQVGLAAASQRDVMKDGSDPLAEKLLSIYAPTGINEKKLKGLNMIAIGQQVVK